MIENVVEFIHFTIENLPELTELEVTTGLDIRNQPQCQTMMTTSYDDFAFVRSEFFGYGSLKVVRI